MSADWLIPSDEAAVVACLSQCARYAMMAVDCYCGLRCWVVLPTDDVCQKTKHNKNKIAISWCYLEPFGCWSKKQSRRHWAHRIPQQADPSDVNSGNRASICSLFKVGAEWRREKTHTHTLMEKITQTNWFNKRLSCEYSTWRVFTLLLMRR